MATKLGEAFIEVTARDAKLKVGLDNARRQAEAATRKPVQLGFAADFKETFTTMRALGQQAADLRGKLFYAIPGSERAKDLNIALKDVNERLGVTKGHLSDMRGRFMQMAAVALTALTTIAYGIRIVTRAAIEQEDADVALVAALSRVNAATDKRVSSLKEFASAMQQVTVYTDEQVELGMALMANISGSTENLEEMTRAAIGLAAAFRIPVETAFKLVGRAAAGQTQMLTRYGIAIDTTKSKTEQFAQVLQIGASHFRTAEKEARTAGGSMKQWSNTVSELYEAIGTMLLPALKDLLAVAKPVAESLTKAFSDLSGVVQLIGISVKYVVGSLQNLIRPALYLASLVGRISGLEITADADAYAKELGKAEQRLKSLATTTETTAEETEEVVKLRKQVAELQSVNAAADAYEREQARRDSFAQKVLARVQALRQQKAAEEDAQRAAMGWTSLGDMYKKAMTAGLMQRFGAGPNSGRGFSGWGLPGKYSGGGLTGSAATVSQAEVANAIHAMRQDMISGNQALLKKLGDIAPEWAL